MAAPIAMLLCLGVALWIGWTHAWSAEEKEESEDAGEKASEDHVKNSSEYALEDRMLRRFQLGYELWQRQCEKYPQEPEKLVSERISRGDLAELGMFPYQAALLLQLPEAELEEEQCGATLISQNFVLTAAHCLIEAVSGTIYLGATQYANEAAAEQVFQVQRADFKIYPDYPGFGFYNDLALIRLPRAAKISKNVQPIQLARSFMQQSLLQDEIVSSSGWGDLGDNEQDNEQDSNLLRYVKVQILEQQRCICYFLPGLVSRQRHICSDGRGGRGACQGDSGGPLVYQWRNVSYLIGLTTFGPAKGCQLGAPTVYTRITAYLEWIVHETSS